MGKNWIGVFQNMKRFDGRKYITEQLAALGLLRGKQDHAMRVPFCSRSGDVVELLLKPQWWVLVDMSVGCRLAAFRPHSVVLLHCWQVLMTRDSASIAFRFGLTFFLTYFDLFQSVKLMSHKCSILHHFTPCCVLQQYNLLYFHCWRLNIGTGLIMSLGIVVEF